MEAFQLTEYSERAGCGNNQKKNMTPSQAIDILSQATDPRTVGKMTRGDYVACDQALAVLAELVKKNAETEESKSGKE